MEKATIDASRFTSLFEHKKTEAPVKVRVLNFLIF